MPKSIALLCVALLLSACGQTGALYLPDRAPPKRHAKSPPVKVVAPSTADDKADEKSGAPAAAPAAPAEPLPAADTPPAAAPAQ